MSRLAYAFLVLALAIPASPHDARAEPDVTGHILLLGEQGAKVQLDPKAIFRIRSTTASEQSLHPAAVTLVDYVIRIYVRDSEDAVVAAVTQSGRLATLCKLKQPSGRSIWFDCKKASGPLPVPAAYKKEGVLSALNIGGKVQYLQDAPEDVLKIIAANQGVGMPLAPKSDTEVATRGLGLESAWDEDVPELAVKPAQ